MPPVGEWAQDTERTGPLGRLGTLCQLWFQVDPTCPPSQEKARTGWVLPARDLAFSPRSAPSAARGEDTQTVESLDWHGLSGRYFLNGTAVLRLGQGLHS